MTTRTLSAYFDDYRQGKKDFALLQAFLKQVFDQEPVRRGHLLHWLDQAQYEHPIPVTDFLLLRKEVETALKTEREKTPPEEATIIAGTGSFTPGAMTLMAAPEATVVANQAATLVAPAPDMTPPPERSDHAGFHEAATSFDPRRQPTLTSTAARRALQPPPRPNRLPLVAGASVLAMLAALGGALLKQNWGLEPSLTTPPVADASVSAPAALNQLLREAPTGSIGDTKPSTTPLSRAEPLSQQASNPATSGQVALDQAGTVTSEDTPPLPALDTLDAPALIQLISERITQQRLLPADDAASAHAAFKTLETRFAGHPGIIDARIQLKDAHLKLSDQARSQGQWEAAQQHLDAAFEVLQPEATQSLSATAPSNGS